MNLIIVVMRIWGREDQGGFPYLDCLKFVLEMYSCVVNNDKKNPQNRKDELKYKGHPYR